ncbi:p87/vp80 [Cryptophlebia peltastica nucleopolyhedrovirus]|uniref:p87/vp80 n=1 Tax=Cryptophlebia peltastica nucleopolyhedrovirus TaxID=2304025 RepID=A0A346RNV1_9ABAC|nr:p87/vp80 [Cryptophlebia peltastica nucleopolyhedrovirus]AXS67748.1 p87/vp80 [Cryptophlebia peltastica nucleopolyhedrovirus]
MDSTDLISDINDDAREYLIINNKSIPHKIVKIGADGACLFRAIALFKYGDQNMHLRVRDEIVKYVIENWDDFSNYTCDETTNCYKSIYEYEKFMSQPQTYGSTTELYAASIIYAMRFEVYKDQKLYGNGFGDDSFQIKRLRFSGHNMHGHFDVYLADDKCDPIREPEKQNENKFVDLMYNLTKRSYMIRFNTVQAIHKYLVEQALPEQQMELADIGDKIIFARDQINTGSFELLIYELAKRLNELWSDFRRYSIINNLSTNTGATVFDSVKLSDVSGETKRKETQKRKVRRQNDKRVITKNKNKNNTFETVYSNNVQPRDTVYIQPRNLPNLETMLTVSISDRTKIDITIPEPLMPFYIQSIVANIPTTTTYPYITYPTKNLSIVPSRENFETNINIINEINKSILDNNVHFYEMLEALLYYGGNETGQVRVLWFISIAEDYFKACADHFDNLREQFANEPDVDRFIVFIIKYNFLWHYRQFISTLNSSMLTSYQNQKIVRFLQLTNESVQKKFDRINIRFDLNVVYVNKVPQVVQLMIGCYSKFG